MDWQLGVTDDVGEQHMRDFQLNFFFNLGSHMDSHGNTSRHDTLKQLPRVECKARPREIAPHYKGVLPISIQSVYSSQIVPVVQRIERRIPNAKTAFL